MWKRWSKKKVKFTKNISILDIKHEWYRWKRVIHARGIPWSTFRVIAIHWHNRPCQVEWGWILRGSIEYLRRGPVHLHDQIITIFITIIHALWTFGELPIEWAPMPCLYEMYLSYVEGTIFRHFKVIREILMHLHNVGGERFIFTIDATTSVYGSIRTNIQIGHSYVRHVIFV